MKPTRKEKRVIARRARLLPEMEHANKYDRKRVTGGKLLAENPEAKDGHGQPIDPKKDSIVPVHRRVNHFDEMCSAFTKEGIPGVEKYEAYILETHAKNIEDIKAEAQRIHNERLAAAQDAATPNVEQEGGAE